MRERFYKPALLDKARLAWAKRLLPFKPSSPTRSAQFQIDLKRPNVVNIGISEIVHPHISPDACIRHVDVHEVCPAYVSRPEIIGFACEPRAVQVELISIQELQVAQQREFDFIFGKPNVEWIAFAELSPSDSISLVELSSVENFAVSVDEISPPSTSPNFCLSAAEQEVYDTNLELECLVI